MPRSKDPAMYPPTFGPALLAAYNSLEPIRWPVTSGSKAQTMRQQMYAFIRAVKQQEADEFVTKELSLAVKYQQISIKSIELTTGWIVELMNKNNTPEMLALAKIIGPMDTTDHGAEAHRAAARRAMIESPVEHADTTTQPEPSLRALFTNPGDTNE